MVILIINIQYTITNLIFIIYAGAHLLKFYNNSLIIFMISD